MLSAGCLAQMGDLQRLFILLIRSHQSPHQDTVYLRDLIHTNHTYLFLLEEWLAQGCVPSRFSMLAHIKQYVLFFTSLTLCLPLIVFLTQRHPQVHTSFHRLVSVAAQILQQYCV